MKLSRKPVSENNTYKMEVEPGENVVFSFAPDGVNDYVANCLQGAFS